MTDLHGHHREYEGLLQRRQDCRKDVALEFEIL